ncbi:MAG TPA: hypothetical protein VEI97_20600, partial [bacterium]|nr:hypothetical protein [bacterium]
MPELRQSQRLLLGQLVDRRLILSGPGWLILRGAALEPIVVTEATVSTMRQLGYVEDVPPKWPATRELRISQRGIAMLHAQDERNSWYNRVTGESRHVDADAPKINTADKVRQHPAGQLPRGNVS